MLIFKISWVHMSSEETIHCWALVLIILILNNTFWCYWFRLSITQYLQESQNMYNSRKHTKILTKWFVCLICLFCLCVCFLFFINETATKAVNFRVWLELLESIMSIWSKVMNLSESCTFWMVLVFCQRCTHTHFNLYL